MGGGATSRRRRFTTSAGSITSYPGRESHAAVEVLARGLSVEKSGWGDAVAGREICYPK